MKYDIEVLKTMIDITTRNIEMFQGYGESQEQRMYDMVKQRRDLAALIENDGEELPGVNVCMMSYASARGDDTSWWG